MKKNLLICLLLTLISIAFFSCVSVTGGGKSYKNYYYKNNSSFYVNIEFPDGRSIESLAPGDTAKIVYTIQGSVPNYESIVNPYYEDKEGTSNDFTVYGLFENQVAKITFITDDVNLCLLFEGEPTTADYPDIRLESGYERFYSGTGISYEFIYTITDSLFEKASVCE